MDVKAATPAKYGNGNIVVANRLMRLAAALLVFLALARPVKAQADGVVPRISAVQYSTGAQCPTAGASATPAATPPQFALGDDIRVCFSVSPPDLTKLRLVLDGRTVTNAKSVRACGEANCVLFTLRRSTETREAWNALLGGPTASFRQFDLAVSGLSTQSDPVAAETPIHIALLRPWSAFSAAVVGLLVLGLAIALGHSSDLFRDNLLPQVPAMEQPYSLGRLQMGFWFILILVAFMILWLYVGDYDTLTTQSLTLMGISAATGLGAIAANGFNRDNFKQTQAALVDAKFVTPDDVIAVRQQLASKPGGAAEFALQARLDTYKRLTAGYVTQNLWTDILSDDNGTGLHRLQVVVWTVVLGGVFVWSVWLSLAMPEFSGTLLALMAVSGGSYVGFKVAEQT
jgi:hypothetical protein